MNELTTQQLIFQSKKWPWKWFSIFRKAAALCEQEICKFDVLVKEHKLITLENGELHKQRVVYAERIQELRDEYQLLKLQIAGLEQQRVNDLEREKLISLELDAIRRERELLITEHRNAIDGSKFMFEYIRRLKLVDANGKKIPELPRFSNMFRR